MKTYNDFIYENKKDDRAKQQRYDETKYLSKKERKKLSESQRKSLIFKRKEKGSWNDADFPIQEKNLSDVDYSEVIDNSYMKDVLSSDNMETFIQIYKIENEYDDLDDLDDDEIEASEKFKNWLKYDIENRYDNVVNELGYKIKDDNTIDLWRIITVNDNWLDHIINNGKRLGIYWSWNENSAEAHWADSSKSNTVVIKTSVSEKLIDWVETIQLNMNISLGEEEKEIRLFKNTSIKIEELYINGENVLDGKEGEKIRNKIYKA